MRQPVRAESFTPRRQTRRRLARTLVSLAALMTLTTAVLSTQARSITALDVVRLRSVASVALSPDGTQIAYTLTVPRRPFAEDDGPAWQELHLLGTDGPSQPFVTGPVNVSQVRWLPDGRHLSFLQKRTGDKETALYVIPAEGGEARRVLEHATGVGAYVRSPDY